MKAFVKIKFFQKYKNSRKSNLRHINTYKRVDLKNKYKYTDKVYCFYNKDGVYTNIKCIT